MWAGLAGSVLIHSAAILFLVLSIASAPRAQPPSYAVQLIAAPPNSGAPAPATSRPAPETPPVSAAKPKPAPAKPAARPNATRTTAPRSAAPVTPLPGETPASGSDIANVDLKGKTFPYPEYLRNLVSEIYRRWNRPAANAALITEVGFIILRDGTVKDIVMVSSSRSYSFDLEARGAVEEAGRVKAFGPLPAGYPADYLQISFTFAPRRP